MFVESTVREAMDTIASLTVTLRELVRSLSGAAMSPSEAARELQIMEALAQVAGYGQLVSAGTAKQAQVEQLGERGMAASRDNLGASAAGGKPSANNPVPDGQSGADGWAVPGVSRAGADGPEAAGNAWTGGAVYRDTGAFMADALRITGREARDRLAFAAAVLPRPAISGPALPPACPTVAASLAEGRLGTGKAGQIVRAVRKAAPAASRLPGGDELLEAMEEATAVLAATATPIEVSKVLSYWLERFDENTEPDERARRHFEGVFDRGTRHGLREFLLRCLPEDSETLRTVMNLFTNPRTEPRTEPDSETGSSESHGDEGRDAAGSDGGGAWKVPIGNPWNAAASDPDAAGGGRTDGSDEPTGTNGFSWSAWAAGAEADGNAEASGGRGTRAQQLLHGLLAALRAALAGGGMPQSGGLRPQLMVHIDYDALTGTGTGLGTYEQRMPAAEVRRLACEADILPVVLSGAGEILDLGRAQRLFTAAQRKALAARDRGCAFPGCGIPAAWAEAHHINPWQAGGGTDIANGVLLCGHHHRIIHRKCWNIEVRDGVPWFLPPDYVDPARTPRRNLCRHPETAFQPRIPARE